MHHETVKSKAGMPEPGMGENLPRIGEIPISSGQLTYAYQTNSLFHEEEYFQKIVLLALLFTYATKTARSASSYAKRHCGQA